MLHLKTKLMNVCTTTTVIFNNRQNTVLSLVSPVLFLIIGTIAVVMSSDCIYLCELKQLNEIDKIT